MNLNTTIENKYIYEYLSNISNPKGIVHICHGMAEHIGKKFYKTYFKKINDLLKDDGIGLVHTIGSIDKPQPPAPFIQKYIFPGGIIPSLSDLISPIEKTGLIVNDVETLIRNQISSTWYFNHGQMYEQAVRLNDEKMIKARISLPERFVPINPGIKAYWPNVKPEYIAKGYSALIAPYEKAFRELDNAKSEIEK